MLLALGLSAPIPFSRVVRLAQDAKTSASGAEADRFPYRGQL